MWTTEFSMQSSSGDRLQPSLLCSDYFCLGKVEGHTALLMKQDIQGWLLTATHFLGESKNTFRSAFCRAPKILQKQSCAWPSKILTPRSRSPHGKKRSGYPRRASKSSGATEEMEGGSHSGKKNRLSSSERNETRIGRTLKVYTSGLLKHNEIIKPNSGGAQDKQAYTASHEFSFNLPKWSSSL